ncbi:hypothetical protein E2320_007311 [Naja naja]|nr:hypothetical protein E2320_007311 [Naja naja]
MPGTYKWAGTHTKTWEAVEKNPGGEALEGIHGLEFTEGLYGRDVLLLGAPPHPGLVLLRLFPLHQWLLLRGFHLPGDHRRVDSGRAVDFLVFGGSHVGGFDANVRPAREQPQMP